MYTLPPWFEIIAYTSLVVAMEIRPQLLVSKRTEENVQFALEGEV